MPKKRKPAKTNKPSIARAAAAMMRKTPNGGHRWTVHNQGVTITTNTSSSSVSIITEIGRKYAPALKRLAKE
jgi:hypothetical protein